MKILTWVNRNSWLCFKSSLVLTINMNECSQLLISREKFIDRTRVFHRHCINVPQSEFKKKKRIKKETNWHWLSWMPTLHNRNAFTHAQIPHWRSSFPKRATVFQLCYRVSHLHLLPVITTNSISLSLSERRSDPGNAREISCVSEVADSTVNLFPRYRK